MEGIGIGGVMAEVAWLASKGKPVLEHILVAGLCGRFDVPRDRAKAAIALAESCGVIERTGNQVFLKGRPR